MSDQVIVETIYALAGLDADQQFQRVGLDSDAWCDAGMKVGLAIMADFDLEADFGRELLSSLSAAFMQGAVAAARMRIAGLLPEVCV